MLTREEVKNRGILHSFQYFENQPDEPFEIIAYNKIGFRKAWIKLDKNQCEDLIESLQKHLGTYSE